MRIRDRVKEVVKGVDMISHLAAYAAEGQSIFSPVAINEINIVPMNNLLVEAINNGVESFVLDDLSSSRVASVRQHMANPKFKLLEGSVLDQRKIDEAVAGADEAAHLVAVVSVNLSLEDPNLVHRTNVERTLNVLESSLRHSVKKDDIRFYRGCLWQPSQQTLVLCQDIDDAVAAKRGFF